MHLIGWTNFVSRNEHFSVKFRHYAERDGSIEKEEGGKSRNILRIQHNYELMAKFLFLAEFVMQNKVINWSEWESRVVKRFCGSKDSRVWRWIIFNDIINGNEWVCNVMFCISGKMAAWKICWPGLVWPGIIFTAFHPLRMIRENLKLTELNFDGDFSIIRSKFSKWNFRFTEVDYFLLIRLVKSSMVNYHSKCMVVFSFSHHHLRNLPPSTTGCSHITAYVFV